MPATDSVTESDFDWFSPEVCRDPQKYDAMIREAGPVVYSPRYDNPARFTRRRSTTAVDLDGVELPEDARLLLLHMPGGRDPRRWENPEAYDITRDVVGKHLGLGFGVHACVGARVARLEGVSLLSALARHVRTIELAGEPEVTTNMAVHGHERLPLRIVPA